MAPNVLLVVLDTARRDATEPYGAPGGSTPAIADLARRGTALPRAYATASWTLPSHASMFTGMLPRRLGLGQPPGETPQSARPALERVADRVLANVLRSAGYATHGFSTNLWASQHTGFDIGFDSFRYISSGRDERMNALLSRGSRAQLAWGLEGLRSTADDGAAEAGWALRSAIDAWSGQPTFWFVNLIECHSPYLPPRPWNDLPPADRVRAAVEARKHLNFQSICLYAAGRREIPAEALERMRHLYGRAVAYMDSWLADILGALDRRGILDDTLVLLTSDHGENFGEGGLIAHGFSVDERLIGVPLVIAGPGAVPHPGVFSLAELPRLIAEGAGIERHPWSREALPEGIAIAQCDPMAPATDPRVREFAQRWSLDDPAIGRLCAQFTSATDGRHKLVLRDAEELLYDLDADPREERPLRTVGAEERTDALRAALAHPAVSATGPDSAEQEPAGAGADDELALLERQMKLLGYM